jgi:hypothetical protein
VYPALQVLATTCIVSAALINGAREEVEQFAKKEADKALHARRRSSSSGAAATASSNGNGNSEAPAAGAGKKSTSASPLKQRVSTCAVSTLCRVLELHVTRCFCCSACIVRCGRWVCSSCNRVQQQCCIEPSCLLGAAALSSVGQDMHTCRPWPLQDCVQIMPGA